MRDTKKRPAPLAPPETEAPSTKVELPVVDDITSRLKAAEREKEAPVSVCSFCYKENCWLEPHILVHRKRVSR